MRRPSARRRKKARKSPGCAVLRVFGPETAAFAKPLYFVSKQIFLTKYGIFFMETVALYGNIWYNLGR
jgi:hypothetical protein